MNKISTLSVLLFCAQVAVAADSPGPPPPTVPPPPGLSIDNGVVILFFLALITGYYLSVKYNLYKKGSL